MCIPFVLLIHYGYLLDCNCSSVLYILVWTYRKDANLLVCITAQIASCLRSRACFVRNISRMSGEWNRGTDYENSGLFAPTVPSPCFHPGMLADCDIEPLHGLLALPPAISCRDIYGYRKTFTLFKWYSVAIRKLWRTLIGKRCIKCNWMGGWGWCWVGWVLTREFLVTVNIITMFRRCRIYVESTLFIVIATHVI